MRQIVVLLALLLPFTGFSTTIAVVGNSKGAWIAADRRLTSERGTYAGSKHKISVFGTTAISTDAGGLDGFDSTLAATVAGKAGKNFDERVRALQLILPQLLRGPLRHEQVQSPAAFIRLKRQPYFLLYVLVGWENGSARMTAIDVKIINKDGHPEVEIATNSNSNRFMSVWGSQAATRSLRQHDSGYWQKAGEPDTLRQLIEVATHDGTHLTGNGLDLVKIGPDGISYPLKDTPPFHRIPPDQFADSFVWMAAVALSVVIVLLLVSDGSPKRK